MVHDRASTEAAITPNFAMKPDVNGTPACASRRTVNAPANTGLRVPSPL